MTFNEKINIKLVIFDLAEVLLRGFLGTEEILAPRLKIPLEKVYKGLRPPSFSDLLLGKITEDQYIDDVLKKTRWKISRKELKEIIRSNFTEIPGTREIILKLRKKFKVVLLSVHAREWIEYCEEKFDLSKLLKDGMFFSYEMGRTKADEQTFRKVLKQAKINPNQTLFIDDLEANIRSAQRLGIHTIKFENSKQLKKELRRLGII